MQAGSSGLSGRYAGEYRRIQREMVAAASEHCTVLVDTFDCGAVVAEHTHNAMGHLELATASLGLLRTDSSAVIAQGKHWRTRRQVIATAQQQFPKMAELLEAPATFDACIRADMYFEALKVVEHVLQLRDRMPGSAVAAAVAEETLASLHSSLERVILPKLAGSLTVPVLLSLTGFLRNLGVSEQQMQGFFLKAREDFLERHVAEARATTTTSYAFLMKMLTIYKNQITEVFTMFRTCFLISSSSSHGKGSSNNVAVTEQHTNDAQQILFEWSLRHTSVLLDLWSDGLRKVDNGAELGALAEQVGPCAATLAKVGLDIFPLLSDEIINRVACLFISHVHAAHESFSVALKTHSWRSAAATAMATALEEQADSDRERKLASASKNSTKASSEDADQKNPHESSKDSEENEVGAEKDSNNENGAQDSTGGAHKEQNHGTRAGTGSAAASPLPDPCNFDPSSPPSPSLKLLQHLPLAYLVNGVAAACNEVRKAAVLAAAPRCRDAIVQVLASVVGQLREVRDSYALAPPEKAAFNAFLAAAAQHAIPFICQAVDYLFYTGKGMTLNSLPTVVPGDALSDIKGNETLAESAEGTCASQQYLVLTNTALPKTLKALYE